MTDPLAPASEIVVVLGSKRSQVSRARAAAALLRERPGAIAIVSGRAGFEQPHGPTEAEIMADVLGSEGIARDRILLEDESRDTVGNAVLTSLRYLRDAAPRPITLVTSRFHMERALWIFRTVLGPTWRVEGHASPPLLGDEQQVAPEVRYLAEVRRMFADLTPGDAESAAARLRAQWPEHYGDVERLR